MVSLDCALILTIKSNTDVVHKIVTICRSFKKRVAEVRTSLCDRRGFQGRKIQLVVVTGKGCASWKLAFMMVEF